MIQTWKVLSTAALVTALSAAMAIPAFAADGDMVNTSTGTTYLASNYKTDTAAFNALIDQLILDSSHFSYEFTTGGTAQLFNFVDYSNKVTENIAKGESVATAKADAAVTLSVATVKSVSAITGTTVAGTAFALPATVSATMSDATTKQVAVTWDAVAPASYASAGSYTVSGTIAGTTLKASATVTVTGVTADVTKPTIYSIQALNNKTIVVTYSEKVSATATKLDSSNILDDGSYMLYNTTTGVSTRLASVGNGTASEIEANAVFTDATQTAVKFTLTTIGSAVTGYPMGGLSNGNYILYVTGVKDVATIPNTIVAGSNTLFAGTLTADAVAPQLTAAAYDTGLGILDLSFDKAPLAVLVANGAKYSIVNGTTTVALTNTAGNLKGTTGLEFVLTAAQKATLGELKAGATLQIAIGGVVDGSNNANAVVEQLALTSTIRPALTQVAYDELTHKLTLNFNKPIKSASVNYNAQVKLQSSTDGINYTDVASSALNMTDYTLAATTADTTQLVFTMDPTAYAIWQAARDTANITYKVAIQDNTVTDGINVNNVGAAGLTDWDTASLNYAKEIVGPSISAAKYYTNASSTIKDFLTAGVTANNIYIQFDQKSNGAPAAGKVVLSYVKNGATINLDLGSSNAIVKTQLTTMDKTATDGTQFTTSALLDFTQNVLGGAQGADLQAAMKAGTATINILAANAIVDENANVAPVQTFTPAYVDNTAQAAVISSNHSANQIYLTQAGTNFSGTVTAANFNVYTKTNVNDVAAIKSVDTIDTNGDGILDTIVLTTNAAMTPGRVVNVSYTGLKDALGNVITDGVATGDVAVAADISAPSLLGSTFTDVDSSNSVSAGDTVTLTYNEPVKPITAAALSAAYGTGATEVNGSKSNIMVVTLGTSPAITFGTTTLQVASPTNDFVSDITGNTFDGSATVIPTAIGAVGAKITNVTYADVNASGTVSKGDTIEVKFDKSISTSTGIVAGDFTVSGLLNLGTAPTFAIKAGTTDTIVITLDTGANVIPGTTTIDMAVGNHEITSWGTAAQATAKTIVSNDVIAPTLVSATLTDSNSNNAVDAGDTLLLTFSEPTNMNSAFIAGDFATNGTISVADAKQVSPTQVAVTLGATPVITLNSTTIDIAGFGSTKLTDAAQNTVIPSSGKVITGKAKATKPAGFVVTDNAGLAIDTLDIAGVQAKSKVEVFTAAGVEKASAVADASGAVASLNLDANTGGSAVSYIVVYTDANGVVQVTTVSDPSTL